MGTNPIIRVFRFIYKFLTDQEHEDTNLVFGNWGCGLVLFFILVFIVLSAISGLFS